MKKDPLIFLQHILWEINKIENSTKKISKTQFNQNLDIQDATIRRIEIIGEAVKNIPTQLTLTYPDTEWTKIAGMRDKLIHGYFGIDIEYGK
jgi:uncharacterized protein with HEPN domain